MYYLFPFWGFLLIGTSQENPPGYFDPQIYFPIPKYPRLMARACINGDFEVEIQIERGAAKSIKVISANVITHDRQGNPTGSVSRFKPFFVASIDNAVKNWRFSKEIHNGNKHLIFSYRCIVDDDKNMYPGYYIYRVEGVDESMWEELPRRILIEYHHPPLLMDSVTQ